jgi:hypothetical protein
MDWNTIRFNGIRLYTTFVIRRAIIVGHAVQQVHFLRQRSAAHVREAPLAVETVIDLSNCSACSQKLAAWQENGELGLEKLKLSRSAREPKKSKQDTKSAKNAPKPEPKTVSNSENVNAMAGKSKRRR